MGHGPKSHKAFCARSKAERVADYEGTAEDNFQLVKSLYYSKDHWKLEHGKHLEDGILHSQHLKPYGKIYKLDGLIDTKPEYVFCQLVHVSADTPSWNPTVKECKVLESINPDTDIVYNVSMPAAGGMVSSRDFVDVRKNFKDGDVIFSIGGTTFHPDAPENNKYVRGENYISSLIFRPVNGQCLFTMIIKTELKGWLPQKLIDQAMVGSLGDYFSNLQQRMGEVAEMIHEQHCFPGKHALATHGSVHKMLNALRIEHMNQPKKSRWARIKGFHLFHHKKHKAHHTKRDDTTAPAHGFGSSMEVGSAAKKSRSFPGQSKSKRDAGFYVDMFKATKKASENVQDYRASESAEDDQEEDQSSAWKRFRMALFRKRKSRKEYAEVATNTSRRLKSVKEHDRPVVQEAKVTIKDKTQESSQVKEHNDQPYEQTEMYVQNRDT